MYKTNKNI